MGGPITTWMVHGLGTELPLGMADLTPRCPPARWAHRCGRTGRRRPPSGPRRPVPRGRVPSGKSTSTEPLRSTSSARWSASRCGRLAVHREGAHREQQLAEPLALPHLVLGHEEELPVRAERREAEVGEGAVHGRHDHRTGLGDMLAPDHLGAEPRPERGDEDRALDPVQRCAPGLDFKGLVSARRGRRSRPLPPWARSAPAGGPMHSQPRQHLLDHILHGAPGGIESVGIRGLA